MSPGVVLTAPNPSLAGGHFWCRQGVTSACRLTHEALKKDKGVVLAAVKQDCEALQYAEDTLRNDKYFVLVAVKQMGTTLRYAGEILKKDKRIVISAVIE